MASPSPSISVSTSSSYAILWQRFRTFIIVNVEHSDYVDTLLILNPEPVGPRDRLEITRFSPQIVKNMLLDDGLPFTFCRLIFTSNDNSDSVLTSRIQFFDEKAECVLDYVEGEQEHEAGMWMARFVLWCDRFLNNRPKAIEYAVATSNRGSFVVNNCKEEEESCAICHAEYKEEDMMGRLACKHSYHEECIKDWLNRNNVSCPLCRENVFTCDSL